MSLPPSAEVASAVRARVELRDVSQADQPSVLLAATELPEVSLAPGARIPFTLWAPEAPPQRSLSLRVQIDAGGAMPATYLTTQSCPVANTGHVDAMNVPLSKT